MALTAAVATTLAVVCAAAAVQGSGGGGFLVSAPLLVLALLPALVLVARAPDRRPLPPLKERKVLIAFVGSAALLFYVTGNIGVDQMGTIARLALLAVIPLSLLWPSAPALRLCVLVSVGSLVAAAPPPGGAVWPIVGVAVGSAVALVALRRHGAVAAMSSRSTAASGSATAGRRRTTGEVTALLAISALMGLLVAALLPPQSPRGNPQTGDEPGEQAEPVPYLNPSERMDAGTGGSGRGEAIVLRITAPGPSLWRAQTYDRWDGRTWSNSGADRGFENPPQLRQAIVPPGPGDIFTAAEPFVQRVRVEAPAAGLLVASPRAVTVEVARGAVHVGPDGTLRAAPPLGRGATYVVTSSRAEPTEQQLRSTEPSEVDVPDRYLQLPPLPARVRELAAEVAGGASTAYDKALAVDDWLLTNTETALGSDPLPAGADPVERFLFDDRTGSPEQVASVMTVLLRSLGIPARLAVGFLPGDRYALGGDFIVRARDAHAWVEAWFPQAGWVTFDASARLGSPHESDSFLDRLRRLLGALWWLLALALAVAVRWLTLRWIRRWQRQRSRPWVTRCYERLIRVGGRGGRPKLPSETPVEYCAALARKVEDERLVELGALITAGAFSGREPAADTRAWADRVVRDAARRSHRRRPRRGPASERRAPQ